MSAVTKELTVSESSPLATVSKNIRGYLSKGTLHLPHDYSPENAMKSAWLVLQTVQDKDYKPALQTCTPESICNALMSMVIQGLNPDKKQCYFIVYGKALVCQRSYFGDIALVKRVNPDFEVYFDVVYEGEKLATSKQMCSAGLVTVIKDHEQLFPRDGKRLIGAYCGVVDTRKTEDLGIELMDMAQIKKSWGMSKTYKEGGNSPHNTFPDQMALRTVIRRRCKSIINSSSDALLLGAIRESDMDAIDGEISEEAAMLGNGQILELPVQEVQATNEKATQGPEVALNASGHVTDDPEEALPF